MVTKIIDDCSAECKYYFLHLYENISNLEKTTPNIERTVDLLILLIQNINNLKNVNLSSDSKTRLIQDISEHYNALVSETGSGGIFYKSKQTLIGLGGIILGIFSALLGGTVGCLTLGIKDIANFRIPTGAFVGLLTGLFIGFIIGYRIPNTLFKDTETRIIQHSVRNLANTFESLFTSSEKNYLELIKKEILEENFQGNQDKYNDFLVTKHKYEILGVKTIFFSTKLQGFLGHHNFIKFSINNTGNPKVIEVGATSANETNFSQLETREATGEQLIQMLVMHKILQCQYAINMKIYLK